MGSSGYQIPNDLLYTKEHEWAKETNGTVRIGITDYAAKTLNDVVYVTLPKSGDSVTQFKTLGTVESIKAVSELFSPLSGTITTVNEQLTSHPEMVNKEPYQEGWIAELKPSDKSEWKNLLTAKDYAEHLATLK